MNATGADSPGITADDSTAFVVSPYLSVLPPRLWAIAYSGIADASHRRALASRRRKHRLVFDHLSSTIVAVSREDFAFLEELREGRDPARRADSPSELAALRRLAAMGLVIERDEVWRRHRYEQVDIEINSHCNFRCSFCPVSDDPLPKKVMPPELIQTVMDRVSAYGVTTVALNHYGEPTLSPHLVTSVRLASERGLRVLLYTNASRLNPEMSRELAALGNVSLVVNLPTSDSDEFRRVTRTRLHDRVLKNIRAAVESGLRVWLSINTVASMTRRQRREVRAELVRQTGANAFLTRVISRAGSMTNRTYATAPTNDGRLSGCLPFLQKVSVSVEGKVILCCNDYKQENVLGDLRQSTFEEIVNGDRAIALRRAVFGGADAPEDLICRSCEETRPRDGHVYVGSLVDWRSSSRMLERLRTSLELRRVLGRFPIRLDEHTASRATSWDRGLTVAGMRFR